MVTLTTTPTSFFLSLLLSVLLLTSSSKKGSRKVGVADGHGYMIYPLSRQAYSKLAGVQPGSSLADLFPRKDCCPQGSLEGGDTYGVCGLRGRASKPIDYTNNWKLANGEPMPWTPQAVYTEGDEIVVDSIFVANHRGHFEMGLCVLDNGAELNQACFEATKLEFLRDDVYGTPKDVNYPERAYIPPSSFKALDGFSSPMTAGSPSGFFTSHTFQLPMGVTGNQVLLQWHWKSNLGCRNAGYDVYPWPDGWEVFGSMSKVCAEPLPDSGDSPQQYWQCAEIVILPSGPTPPPPPTEAPSKEPSVEPQPTDVPSVEPSVRPVQTQEPSSTPSKPPTDFIDTGCTITLEGNNSVNKVIKVGFDGDVALLDFTDTGLDLDDVRVFPDNFASAEIVDQTIVLTKPGGSTISESNPGGFKLERKTGEVPELINMPAPICYVAV